MKNFLLVFIGGGLGSSCRYLLGLALNSGKYFLPYGTLLANILGSLLIGLLLAFFINSSAENNMRMLAIVGFCGGFTTMSTFSAESIQFLQDGKYQHFILYLALTLIACLGATLLGLSLFKA